MQITIEISIEQITESVKEEIARVASRAYSEDGSSLYDAIINKSRDDGYLNEALNKAATTIRSAIGRFSDPMYPESLTDLIFGLDLTERRMPKVGSFFQPLIRNSLLNLTVARYMTMVQQVDYAKQYDELAAADIGMLTKELYQKRAPVRSKEDE